eukprot:CAMPEP_0180511566 /NCGR_PEP_ID=MMETSP1036_2-20121128/51075_1 /TAXON_ID=632150 /ORGANISM="Azadinium spinosum, Strain 3D9" /LENGTH=100 /DNA_ID=CAMNT_0022522551 /DNA_START=60 /DNA_END=362 /DNA_ORIENTATION=+
MFPIRSCLALLLLSMIAEMPTAVRVDSGKVLSDASMSTAVDERDEHSEMSAAAKLDMHGAKDCKKGNANANRAACCEACGLMNPATVSMAARMLCYDDWC